MLAAQTHGNYPRHKPRAVATRYPLVPQPHVNQVEVANRFRRVEKTIGDKSHAIHLKHDVEALEHPSLAGLAQQVGDICAKSLVMNRRSMSLVRRFICVSFEEHEVSGPAYDPIEVVSHAAWLLAGLHNHFPQYFLDNRFLASFGIEGSYIRHTFSDSLLLI